MALQQKKVLSKTSKVRTSTGGAASNLQAQVCLSVVVAVNLEGHWRCGSPQLLDLLFFQSLPSEIEVKYKIAECYTILKLDKDAIAVLDGIPSRQRTPKVGGFAGPMRFHTKSSRVLDF